MSVATYAARGRYGFWVGASATMYLELTDDEGDYLNDALAIAGWGMATGALIVPEVASTLLGWGITRAAQETICALAGAGRTLAPVARTIVTAAAPITAGCNRRGDLGRRRSPDRTWLLFRWITTGYRDSRSN